MITIKQIAQKAGVSATSVSNVLHGRNNKISKENLKKIQIILQEENYAPNMAAMILAHNHSKIIGVIIFAETRSNQTIFEDPFTGTIIGTMEEEIKKNGYFMMLQVTHDPGEVIRLAATWKLDGLILLWVPSIISSLICQKTAIPVVFIDCYFNDTENQPCNIGLEDKKGAYEMTRYLIAMGHSRIAFLADKKVLIDGDLERFNGFKDALKEANIPVGSKNFISFSRNKLERETVFLQLCTHTNIFTALFFASDFYATEAIIFFQERNISIPERYSIAGFDDNMLARLIRPRLTTVRQNVPLKGVLAVQSVMKMIRGETTVPVNVRLQAELVKRDSVRRYTM